MQKFGPNGQGELVKLPPGLFWKPGKKSGSFYVAYAVPGKTANGKKLVKQQRVGKKLSDAKRALTAIRNKIDNNEYIAKKDIRFNELSTLYLEEKSIRGLRQSSIVGVKSAINRTILPAFGHRKLKTLEKTDIIAWLKKLIDDGMKAGTAGKHLALLKSILKKGAEEGFLGRNPAVSVRPPKHVKPEIKMLSNLEVEELLKIAEGQPRLIILTGLLSGLRAGEILALRWQNIDLVEGILSVRKTYQMGRFEEPKTQKSKRGVIIPEQLVTALAKAKPDNAGDNDLVFADKNGQPLNWVYFLHKHWNPLLQKAGVQHVKFHSLRHNYASLLLAAGEDLAFLQRQLGHATLTMTLNVYGHLIKGREVGAGQRIGKAFAGYVNQG